MASHDELDAQARAPEACGCPKPVWAEQYESYCRSEATELHGQDNPELLSKIDESDDQKPLLDNISEEELSYTWAQLTVVPEHDVPTGTSSGGLDQDGIDEDATSTSKADSLANQDNAQIAGDARFEFAEHAYIGNNIKLRWMGGQQIVAGERPLNLPNRLRLTYGAINGLGGDFYGTTQPISNRGTFVEQCNRFYHAWASLGEDTTRQPQEANTIMGVLKHEMDAINHAFETGRDPSEVYNTLPDVTWKFQQITLSRPARNPSYLGLARINFDHFGSDAHTAYRAGHYVALKAVIEHNNLELGYAINAFADHFLEDLFAAGHLRTPRRYLHSTLRPAWDLCAKYMHDEENAIGLVATNRVGNSWQVFGDKRLLDQVTMRNRQLCQAAVQTSAEEVYTAWNTGILPNPNQFGALRLVPSPSRNQQLVPLFTPSGDGNRRSTVADRRTNTYTRLWTAEETVVACRLSGRWNYPITLD